MVRACSRAFALSVMPGNKRRTSIAADNSPSRSKAVRIAAASASVTTNMAQACATEPQRASDGLPDRVGDPGLTGGLFLLDSLLWPAVVSPTGNSFPPDRRILLPAAPVHSTAGPLPDNLRRSATSSNGTWLKPAFLSRRRRWSRRRLVRRRPEPPPRGLVRSVPSQPAGPGARSRVPELRPLRLVAADGRAGPGPFRRAHGFRAATPGGPRRPRRPAKRLALSLAALSSLSRITPRSKSPWGDRRGDARVPDLAKAPQEQSSGRVAAG